MVADAPTGQTGSECRGVSTMSRWRVTVLVLLIAAPFVFLAAAGSYFLWTKTEWGFAVWWGMAGCMAIGYLLGWYWQHKRMLLRPVDFGASPHWTDRDRQAWQLVEARAKSAPQLDPDRLSELQFYVDLTQEMALELARFYHPRARDPVGALTLPEILAVVELASHDLGELVDQYLPGGHLLTVNDWRRARQVTDWYRTASNVYWLVSALFSPINTGLRYAASQVGISRPLEMLQQNLIAWFYTAFVQRLGTYLIELNSGRLRVGVRRYRELMGQAPLSDGAAPADAADHVRRVTITVMGQVKAGKSSLINALLGEQRARTDVLPATDEITRYELQPEGVPTRLVLLDTVGYGHAGPKEDQLRATEEAARQSDVLLLVTQARNPARQADAQMLDALRDWFAARPELKLPPVLAVVTHVDLLSPAMEWDPPYDWEHPQRPKEQQVQQALAALRDQLGRHLVGAVPVCTAPGRVYGVKEWLLPVLVELLDEAHAVALLRCLQAEADTGKIRKLFRQLVAAGQEAVKILWVGEPK
jgi:predicted GTPase